MSDYEKRMKKIRPKLERLMAELERECGMDVMAHFLFTTGMTAMQQLYGNEYMLRFYEQMQSKLKQKTAH